MGVTIEPYYPNVTSTRPVVFEFFGEGTDAQPVDRALIDLYIDGSVTSKTTILAYPYRVVEDVFSGINAYYFKVDVSRYLDDCLAPFAGQFEHFKEYSQYIEAYAIEFYLRINYLNLDTDGLLIPHIYAQTDITNTFNAVDIPRINTGDMYFLDIQGDQTAPYQTDKFASVLTNMPNTTNACYEKKKSFSVFANSGTYQLNAFFIEAFDENGNSLGTEAYKAALSPITTGEILTTELTFESLHYLRNNGYELPLTTVVTLVDDAGNIATNPTGILIDYSDPSDYRNIARLEFFFGFNFNLGDEELIQNTERMIVLYNEDCCCTDDRKGITIHWLNALSGIDSYTFCTDIKRIKNTTSTQAKKALSWAESEPNPHSVDDVGLFRVSTRAQNSYRITTKPLSPIFANAIDELFDSVKVYREDSNNNLISVVVRDVEQIVADSKGRVVYQFTVDDSNQNQKQRI